MEKPWEGVAERVKAGDRRLLEAYLTALTPMETARAISRLDDEDRERLFQLLSPREAAAVIQDLPDATAAEVIEEMSPEEAAPIVQSLPSDDRADILGDVSQEAADAILEEMAPEQAADARRLLAYPDHTAGGLMVTEFLAFSVAWTVRQVVADLRANAERYTHYDVLYTYVVSAEGRLQGVLRIRDLLMSPPETTLGKLMRGDPLSVRATDPLEQLLAIFHEHPFVGIPVTDEGGRLLGVVRHDTVHEAVAAKADQSMLSISGILGGEELRSMSAPRRVAGRLSWLGINVLLNVVAASVIAVYQETISAAVVLAVFLPIISDMSGNAGTQAVAVSIRELSLGMVRPNEVWRVLRKEIGVGLFNGLMLGLLLASVALLWQGNAWLGLVVGVALALNTAFSAVIGGMLPLVLKRFGVDPALASGPILTTVTDISGFFLVLSFATLVLPLLAS
jgi:magnesium transporter